MVDVTIVVDSVRALLRIRAQERLSKICFRNLRGKIVQVQCWRIAVHAMGFPLIKSQSVSERVCRSCGHKIRNALELYKFTQTAVTCSNDSATGNETEESDLQECTSK